MADTGTLAPDTLATVLILLSALLHATWNAWLKQIPDKLPINCFFAVIGGAVFIPITFFVPLPPAGAWSLIALSTLVHVLYQLGLIRMLDRVDFTVGYPIARGMGPLFVTLYTVLVYTGTLSGKELIAIAMVITGVMLTGFLAARHTGTILWKSPELAIALFTGLMIGTYTLIDSTLVKMGDSFLSIVTWMNIAFIPGFLSIAWWQRGPIILRQMFSAWRIGLPITILAMSGYTMALYAFRLGTTAEIAALRETSIIFAGLIGYIFLSEILSKARWISLILIAMGAITLKSI